MQPFIMILVVSQKFFLVIFGINFVSLLYDIILSQYQSGYQLFNLTDLPCDLINISDPGPYLPECIRLLLYILYRPAYPLEIGPQLSDPRVYLLCLCEYLTQTLILRGRVVGEVQALHELSQRLIHGRQGLKLLLLQQRDVTVAQLRAKDLQGRVQGASLNH